MARAGPSVAKTFAASPHRDNASESLVAGVTAHLARPLRRRHRGAEEADPNVLRGKVVAVARDRSIRQALAVKEDRLIRVRTDEVVPKTRGPRTTVVDLGGKMVLPGLIDSHTHPTDASLTEFDHTIPEMETVGDVLDYVRSLSSTGTS